MSSEEFKLLARYFSVANNGIMKDSEVEEELGNLPPRSRKVMEYAANSLLVKDKQIEELTSLQDICMSVIGSEPEFIFRIEALLCKCYEGASLDKETKAEIQRVLAVLEPNRNKLILKKLQTGVALTQAEVSFVEQLLTK